jgi:hypothetical protein
MFQYKTLSLHLNKYFRNITFYEYFRPEKGTNFSCAWSINDKEKKVLQFFHQWHALLNFLQLLLYLWYSTLPNIYEKGFPLIIYSTPTPMLYSQHFIFFITYR